jgi:hypothetical protein
MKKMPLVGLCLLTTLITACSSTMTMTKEAPLENGGKTRISTGAPEASWECDVLSQESFNGQSIKLKGLIRGEYAVLKDKALESANKMEHKPNFIFMYIPMGINGIATDNARLSYYACKNLPAQF